MKVSFVVPSYNNSTWLPHAITSCLQQTYKDIEIVVIDDGSTDDTWELAKFYESDPRIKWIRNEKNVGRSEARNIGNAAASGDIICVLDADDLATPNRAEIMVKKFRGTTADFVYGAATGIDAIGNPLYILGADLIDKNKVFDENKNPKLDIRIVHSAAAYTKEYSNKFPYPANKEISDMGLDDWAQQASGLIAGMKFDYVVQRLCCYRQLNNQISRKRDASKVIEIKRKFLASLRVPV